MLFYGQEQEKSDKKIPISAQQTYFTRFYARLLNGLTIKKSRLMKAEDAKGFAVYLVINLNLLILYILFFLLF